VFFRVLSCSFVFFRVLSCSFVFFRVLSFLAFSFVFLRFLSFSLVFFRFFRSILFYFSFSFSFSFFFFSSRVRIIPDLKYASSRALRASRGVGIRSIRTRGIRALPHRTRFFFLFFFSFFFSFFSFSFSFVHTRTHHSRSQIRKKWNTACSPWRWNKNHNRTRGIRARLRPDCKCSQDTFLFLFFLFFFFSFCFSSGVRIISDLKYASSGALRASRGVGIRSIIALAAFVRALARIVSVHNTVLFLFLFFFFSFCFSFCFSSRVRIISDLKYASSRALRASRGVGIRSIVALAAFVRALTRIVSVHRTRSALAASCYRRIGTWREGEKKREKVNKKMIGEKREGKENSR
jgi:hypothetical protein